MPSCQFCGKDHGNEGANKRHEKSCPHNPDNGEVEVAEGGGGLPAGLDEEAMTLASSIGDVAFSLTSEDPIEQERAKAKGVQILGGTLLRVGQRHAEEVDREYENAQQTRSEDLEVVEDLPTCPNCDGTIDRIPSDGAQFACPHCSARLKRTA